MTNPLVRLNALGQSVWYDNIRRGLLTAGTLKAYVDAGEVRGVTSNPTIFEKAIGGSADYDDDMLALARSSKTAQEIFDSLSIDDIRTTADLLRGVYDESGGRDGYVSIEVSPLLARDTHSTVEEARRLWRAVGRPNLMVKIPATAEGIPAIEQCLFDGLNINVTLIFSRARYAQVMDAYLSGLERRAAAGLPIDRIASVASFFVSRVDTKVDSRLEAIVRAEGPGAAQAAAFIGKAAIANAKLAYRDFRETFAPDRFARLASKGAQLQRPLWASTSTKNPAYPDVYYVEALIGPDTVDTVPPQTLDAYRDHGNPDVRIEAGMEEAERHIEGLELLGIRMVEVTAELEVEGVEAFSKSFETLMAAIEVKRREMIPATLTARSSYPSLSAVLGELEAPVRARLDALEAQEFFKRLWAKDASLWTGDPARQSEIQNRLGWLDVHRRMVNHLPEIDAFVMDARQAGFTHAVVLGMGGSSLCAEVVRSAFGVRPGYLDLMVLDSTDPASVRAVERRADPAKTLFIVASKSGSTIEPNMLLAYFWDRVGRSKGRAAGENFVAITDPDTPMEALARERGFRQVFLNPADIGGRYSALSLFGLVPAALMGVDVGELLSRASAVATTFSTASRVHDSPGSRLGAILGEAALAGRDKLTIFASKGLDGLASWIEQIIAESTGKEGRGIVPIVGEPLGRPEHYGNDRLFVHLRMDGKHDRALNRLARAGHLVVTIDVRDAFDLGAQFQMWGLANVVAGAIMQINPFDQPDVQASKDFTGRLIDDYKRKGRVPAPRPVWEHNSTAIAGKRLPPGVGRARTLTRALVAHLERVKPGDYVAITAFLHESSSVGTALRGMRKAIRDNLRVATTAGLGPRFLHSTGQLHKGGPASGVVIQITAEPERDQTIPGEPFSFGVLEAAQALGDLQALEARRRRVIAVRLASPKALRILTAAVVEAAETIGRSGRKATRSSGARPKRIKTRAG